MAGRLRLELLGGMRVTLDNLPVAGFISHKAEALLCYLAVEARPHPRSSLATLLWGELPDAVAATNLRQVLANLRRLLDPFLEISRQSVELRHGPGVWVDSAAFEAAVTAARGSGDPAYWREAASLYLGDFLAGFALRDAPLFDEWATVQRERLRQQGFAALERVAEESVARGDIATATEDTLRLLALEPWHEEAHRQLMWLHVRSGRRGAALAQYHACVRVLDEELGVEPTAETTALYERIKDAGGAPPPRPPMPSTPLIGRRGEIEEIERLFADRAARLVLLMGQGGIGKTHLALHIAAEWGPRFLNGAAVALLGTVQDGETLVETITRAVGFTMAGNDPREALFDFLVGRDMLLVLDNVEHLIAAGAPWLAELLRRAPDVQLLVTSRERLKLREERIITLQGLDLAPEPREGGTLSAAAALFVACSRRHRPDYALNAHNAPHIARLCALVEGFPLAIELAAAWGRLLSAEEIADEIERTLEFLTSAHADVPERHRSLRATFDQSWQRLEQAERQALRRLATFRGGFTREAATVADLSMPLLAALVDRSLLRVQRPGEGAPRYDMHELTRQYATEKLDEAGEREALAGRHAEYFAELAEAAEPHLVGTEQRAWLDRLEADHDNLRAALGWALAEAPAVAIRLCSAAWRFWWLRGYLTEGSRWFAQVLALPAMRGSEGAPGLRAKLLQRAGVLLQVQGRYAEAGAHFAESLELVRVQEDDTRIAMLLNSMGVLAWDEGQYERARRLHEESLELKRLAGNRHGISISLNNLAMVVHTLGDNERANALHRESLALCRELGDGEGIATSLGNLGTIAIDQGRWTEAGRLYAESLVIRRDIGDMEGIADSLEGLARLAALAPGDGATAAPRCAQLYGAAAALREQINTPIPPVDRARHDAAVAVAQPRLAPELWAEAWKRGRALALDEAIRYALEPFTRPAE